eukprot:1158443-Pelagomonas_calceolata.AAC.7
MQLDKPVFILQCAQSSRRKSITGFVCLLGCSGAARQMKKKPCIICFCAPIRKHKKSLPQQMCVCMRVCVGAYREAREQLAKSATAADYKAYEREQQIRRTVDEQIAEHKRRMETIWTACCWSGTC